MRLWKTWTIQRNCGKYLSKLLQPSKDQPTFLYWSEWRANQYPGGISNAFNEHLINIEHTNISAPHCIASNEQDVRLVNFIKSHISEATVFHIPPISTQQVIEDLKSILPNSKATGLDGVGIKPLKLALNAIAPSLTHIYNSRSQAVLFQLILKEPNWFLFIRRTQFTTEIIIAQSQSCQLSLNLSRGMWQNRISGTSLQTILFIETSRLIDHTIRLKLRSWTSPITGLRLWSLESLWIPCYWI